MPEISEKDLLGHMKNNNFSRLYFIYGEDIYLKQKYKERLCDSIVTELPEMNFPKIDGKTSDVQKISDEVYQFPVMCEKRCVLVEDFDIASQSKDNIEALKELFGDIPETTVLIMIFNSIVVDKKKNSWSAVLRCASKFGSVIDCKYKTDAELVKYIVSWGNKRKVIIDNSVARYLIEIAGRDLKKLEAEVDKLCAYKKDYISKSDIDKISAKTPEATQYMLPKAVLNENISESLNILSDLLEMRYDPIVILNSLADSFIDIYRVKTALDCGKKPTDIASDFGYAKNRQFVLTNSAKYARKYSFSTLISCLDILDETDGKLKGNEKNKRLVLETTVILLIETMRGYEIKAANR